MTQARIVWQWLHRRRRVIVFCRELSPVATMVFQMCQQGRTNPMPRLISGWMNESHFGHILNAAGRLASAPLRICDTREPDTFPTLLQAARPHFDHALCDWPLCAQEKAAAHRQMHNAPITLWYPCASTDKFRNARSASERRLAAGFGHPCDHHVPKYPNRNSATS